MSQPDVSRFGMELELLGAMYPDQIGFNSKRRELKFTDRSAVLQLRIPELYPEVGSPDIVSARDATKNDVRDRTKAGIRTLRLAEGEEALDAIIACFQRIIKDTNDTTTTHTGTDSSTIASTSSSSAPEPGKTVVIWLHHLLALSKRKLALSHPSLSGVTKPGYPGVMVFSGTAPAVAGHVNTLKAENWQAFQVRYEGDERWKFAHGEGIREVESMAEVVKDVEGGDAEAGAEGGARRKEEFLRAVGIK
ncbi:hypothetical protein BU26DRAFT_524929 [Trematosphaeria pertusa]|uniref:RWD domain-containing protein n=1 Tax=Trematosphaeria pertusa TaxID=390896 RepID=A0A6A6HUJ6_9PLEO|nr:uncharacterized protein BU26DRAFT_524929 [Trematosphaeria pertusa]KAF2241776.1 hypothetical protein BU26DRAFT_524929 [Trematosphaeria pertusa]